MNRHQVLTGACNAGDQCYAVGSVEGIHFTAYAAGCDIVILASDFQRVQIIPGVAHGNVKVSCVDCSTDTGKIAASYQRRVYIFEPTPLLHHESSHKLDYRWYQTAVFEADCFINCLSWNLEGFRLLTGGEVIQIWTYSQEHHDDTGGSKSVRFQVGEEDSERKLSDQGQGHPLQGQDNQHLQDLETVWDCIWRCKPATAVYHLKYSPDGLLFASAGKADRLVKIWYEDRKIQLPLTRIDSVASPKKEELHYSFVYIAHPRAVTGFSWRKTSKYMPRGSVANMLITSCVDNVCRLWCETILPDDGLVDLEQFDPNASMEPKFHTHRHKKRFIQRLKTIRHAIHKRKKHHKFGPETVMSVPHLNSMASVHDFHKSSLHNNGVAPALHFHLAASINPETDIPLLPVVGAKGENQFNFQLHWLNNKELEFTMEAEIILQELHHGTLGGEEGQEGHHYDNHHDGSDSDHHQEQPETEVGTHYKKKKSKRFKRLHKHSRTHAHRRDSETSNGSDRSDHTSDGISNTPDVPGSVIDALDRKIEVLLRDWHQNPDMMFSIHPVDGSYLVWLVDWLDEYNPYCFRQAQVSFSSRLPHAFPVPDARTMASNLLMYCNYSKMDIKSAMKITETNSPDTTKVQNQPAPATGKSSPGQNDNMLIPNVLLISKHLNGSLNQWQISFSDNSKFSTVVSVAHASRACGHRFRTNNATCHPVLPLLLTTSHHNIPNDSSRSSPTDGSDQGIQMTSSQRSEGSNQSEGEAPVGGVEFCSELILWRVDPVGPLSKSGGIVELARINSPQVSAFSNVAWVPTLLPSSTLGSFSNSPSALFVASDGDSLRLYQAVIDARTLLQEIGPQKKDPTMSFCSNTSSGYSADVPKPPSDLFNIVSVQSSARPGCIIELETIAEASQTWHQIQLLHVFQEQLITGHPSCSPSDMEAIVDLRNSGSFSQNFYLVVLEKLRDHGSVLHMWKITISSQSTIPEEDMTRTYVPDIQLIQDDGSNPASRSGTPDPTPQRPTAVVKLLFSSSKVYSERLSLPDGVDISTATVAAGHLSSASIYPACLAPYSLVTACSDGDLRFWKCDVSSVKAAHGSCMDHSISTTSFEVGVEEEDGVRRPLTSVFTKCEVVDTTYKWEEWSMINQGQNTSAINVPGQPITVSCAYSGRLAVAYRLFGVRVMPDNPHGKLVNLWVAIYECESTGGAEWVLEDTIELKNVSIPDPKAEIDLNCIFSPQNDGLSPRNQSDDGESPAKGLSPSASLVNINRTKSVPSLSTICSVSKMLQANNDYSDLFSTSIIQDDDLDVNVLGTSADSNRSGRQRVLSSTGAQANINPNYFGPGHSQMMTKHLTHTQLPGLSSLDQMYLLAIADTVASIKMDFADRFDSEKSGLSSTESQGTVQANETIDDCGLRFLLAMQHHIYLFRTLQPRQRAILSKQGLRSFNLVWAFHSEATEELLSHIPSMQRGEPQWEELRQFGVGWWINNINILKRTFEKVAKAAFQKKKDPMDAALFYLAMKKKNVLWGLYRSVEIKRMMDFFKHDFTQERWRRAALKNAFDLLGKQRFEHAAAFFLLAGSLDDAIEVCMDKLGDMQLALVICRLYSDTDMMPDSVRKILYTQVLGRDEDGKNYNPDYCSPDPFLRSMALWLFKDYRGSLKTLLHTSEKRKRKVEDHNELEGHNTLPSVFNFYNYLRTHPLLIRERISKAAPNKKNTSVIPGFTRQQTIVSDSAVFVDKVTPMERRLFFKTAHTHFRNGCPLLALEVLSKLPPMTDHEEEDLCEEGEPLEEKCIQTGKLDENSSQNKGDVTDWSQPITNGLGDTNSFNAFDWSTPISSQGKSQSDAFDWSTPSRNFLDEEEPKFQLSSSESENSEDEQNNVEKKEQKKAPKLQKIPTIVLSDEEEDDRRVLFDAESKQSKHKSSSEGGVDIFAQQYKFIACLKVLMEEMRTLATGFEVDGGQLRFQLYIWLEKEVEVLQYLCHYNEELYPDNQDAPPPRNERTFDETDDEGGNTLDVTPRVNRSLSVRSDSSMVSYKPTLHEVILAEKMDFEAKLERMAKRKQWLRTHHQLVRTLASYCMLNGYGGGGLASVQMELLLLLQQELQQEKPQQQLLTPLPFPTTLPLLSASIASSKTVVADPIQHIQCMAQVRLYYIDTLPFLTSLPLLSASIASSEPVVFDLKQHIQCMAQDVLHSVIELTTPPSIATPFNSVLVMRDLSIALSSCVYQCLCDCDSFVVSLNENTDASLEGFTGYNFTKTQAGYLMAGVQKHRRKSNAGDEVVNTSPIKWPGVTSLRVLLAREKDEDAPKLSILMCETLVAVYISLLVNGLATYDCHILYRLVAHRFDQQMWSALFGGGVKTILKVANSNTPPRSGDDVSKQRMRFNMKAMGQAPSSSKEKKTYKETFVPPELSMVTFFMTKPFPSSDAHFSYDSEESLSSEEEEDSEEELTRPNTLPLSAVQQHTDPTSYSWSLIRYTVVKLVLHNLNTFLPVVGVELQELPVCSPLIHAVMKTLEQWSEILHSKLDLFAGPPEEFISGLQFDVTNGAPNTKVHALLNHSNSPFIDNHSTLPIKRLWFHLIRQEPVKEVFLRHIFRRRKEPMQDSTDSSLTNSEGSTTYKEPMKIIHKEQDLITAFALNQANANCLALSTQKEVVEIDISPILSPPNWLEDENELDIEHIKNPNPSSSTDSVDFYVVQTPVDGVQQQSNYTSGVSSPQTGTNTPIHSPMSQTGRGTNIGKGIHIPGITNPQVSHRIFDRSKRLLRMILRRPVPGVRRIGSHPSLPHYLTGSADGSVRLYEWGHMQPLAMLRQPGAFPKVTKVLFSVHGNKCCVSDTEGDICLWQVGIGTNFNKPIMSLKCHNKTTSDFAFVGSSSLIATAGHSSESKNVCLWDTLLPQRSACVHAFTCHEHGCPAVVYAPHHQLLISGGRKGEVCIFDIRQRQLRHTFQAHDVPIRCLAMDPEEEYFVTGSSEGDIKVWGLDVHQLVVNFPGEHSKNTFFRNMGSASGVTQVAIGTGHHLFSCGVDGSMKFRSLPERESMVRYWTA
ncbi:hypothetical protein FSP39_019692 [Pinctada imbricata]|uniref:RAVE complex protein Rav1 C-terminal domain-containing protein n=1 Tax=Pinctada imbricata TaxID=66713 RepID=A0AA89C7T7_PINIB|nr:hypothetical protein FSP39_019692 [Pinctada imbricata]